METREFSVEFDHEEAYYSWLEALRWPHGIRCIYCSYPLVGWLEARGVFQCAAQGCRKQFSATSSTLFHKTRIPLSKWFRAIRVISGSRERITTRALQRDLKLSYKTTWQLRQRIEDALRSGENFLPAYVEEDFRRNSPNNTESAT
jgi:hypothetical protein